MGEVLATRKTLKTLTLNEVGPPEASTRAIVPSFVRRRVARCRLASAPCERY
jgi:hypothetical protein